MLGHDNSLVDDSEDTSQTSLSRQSSFESDSVPKRDGASIRELAGVAHHDDDAVEFDEDGDDRVVCSPLRVFHHDPFGSLHRPWCPCTPTLYAHYQHDDMLSHLTDPHLCRSEVHEVPHYDAVCALVAIVLGDAPWKGHWRLDEQQKAELLEDMDVSADGMLSLQEIEEFSQKHADAIDELPPSVHGLLNSELVALGVSKYDEENNGLLDTEEWQSFLDELEILHLRYMLQVAFNNFRAFWGRGQDFFSEHSVIEMPQMTPEWLMAAAGATLVYEPEGADNLSEATVRNWNCVQIGLDKDNDGTILPRGWWMDLFFYSANNHPLHGIFSCDVSNRTSHQKRLVIELTTCCVQFLIVGLRHTLQGSILWEAAYRGSVLVSMGFWWMLYLLFTCPCGITDKSIDTGDVIARGRKCSGIGFTCAVLLVIGAFTAVVLDTCFFDRGHIWARLLLTLAYRVFGYILGWILMLFVYFNPLFAWGQANHDPKPGCIAWFAFIGDLIGLGQWRIEKQLFQSRCALCAKSLQESGNWKLRRGRERAEGIEGIYGRIKGNIGPMALP